MHAPSHSRVLVGILAALLSAAVVTAGAATTHARKSAQTFPGTHCATFPTDNVLNTPITGLPVDSHSRQWLASMDSGSTYLHPDYGPGGGSSPYGIPFEVTSAHPKFVKLRFGYASQSDRGPYPFSASTPIEGGRDGNGDRHALMIDPGNCKLYELYDAHYHAGNRSTAGSGAIWNLNANALRPAGWTSADAAGLPIAPLLVTYNEVMSGQIDHAIRVTAQTTDTRYLWPARHEAGAVSDGNYPPMGARFRLSARFRLPASECAKACQVVIRAMKTYGLILADNGSNWYFQGATTNRWTYTMVNQLKAIPASAFVAVNESCLEVSPNSGQALQPGTPAYKRRCY